jgi:hypothetical protein
MSGEPDKQPELIPEQVPSKRLAQAVILGALAGLLLVLIPYFTVIISQLLQKGSFHFESLRVGLYGKGLLLYLPFVQGFITGLRLGVYRVGFVRYMGIASIITIMDFSSAILFYREGTFCLLFAAPLFLVVIPFGTFVGKVTSMLFQLGRLNASFIPLVFLTVAYDTQGGPPNYASAISDAVTVNASPEEVWRFIVQYPENNNPPEYWLWKMGLPEPIQSTAEAEQVGAARQCRFTKDVTFDEQITELVPGKVLTFKITRQPNDPEILGHFSLDKGQLYLEKNPDGTTTVIATSWYHLFVQPAGYFDWWAENIVRNVHFRVLNHMKALAEKDTQANVAQAQ